MLNMSISNRERFCNCFAYSSASCLDIRTGRPGAEPLLLWVVRRIKNSSRSILKPLDNAMIWPHATSHNYETHKTHRASIVCTN